MNKRRTRAAAGGFSLIEVIFSLVIFSVIAASLVAVQRTALLRQGSASAATVLHNNATMAGNIIRRSFVSASHVQTPVSGASGALLMVWENVDPGTGAAIDPGEDRKWKMLCETVPTGGHSTLFLYEEDDYTPVTWPMDPLPACGSTPAGVERIAVAGGLPHMTVVPLFTRPSNNIVQITYTLNYNKPGQPSISVDHATQMTLRGPLGL